MVSQTAGTFRVRATFRNPDQILVPGMSVRTQLSLGKIPNAYLVPQRALMRGTNGEATVYVASSGGKAELRTVTTNGTRGNNWIVVGGLMDGDRIVVDGFQKIPMGPQSRRSTHRLIKWPCAADTWICWSDKTGGSSVTPAAPRNAIASFFISRPSSQSSSPLPRCLRG